MEGAWLFSFPCYDHPALFGITDLLYYFITFVVYHICVLSDALQVRRRAVVPAFHKQYYEVMAKMFGDCTLRTVEKLEQATASKQVCVCVDAWLSACNWG